MTTPASTCATCHRTPATGDVPLQHCGRCKSTYYCNATCQRLGWKDHKPNCQPQAEQRHIDLFHSMAAIAGLKFREDDRDLEAAEHPDAIFYIQSFRPWAQRKYNVAGPYTLSAAFLEAGKDLNSMWMTQYDREQPTHLTEWLVKLAQKKDPMTRECAASIKELRVPQHDKQIYYSRFIPEVNKNVAEMWRAARASKTSVTAMYLVWISEGDCGSALLDGTGCIRWVQDSMSTTERKFQRTFTSLEAANACLGRTVGQWVMGETAKHSVHIDRTDTGEKIAALVVIGEADHTIKRVAGVLRGPQMDREGVFINVEL